MKLAFFFLVVSTLLLAAKHAPKMVHDHASHRAICEKAVASEEVFAQFKRDPIYNLTEEYFTFEEGEEFYQQILAQFPELLEKVESIRANDLLGGPRTYTYGSHGELSPTTLFYVKIAGELLQHFGDLTGVHIVEVGGGYGGLARVLHALFSLSHYTIVDLPSSLQLARKYLEKQKVEKVSFVSVVDMDRVLHADLVISRFGVTAADQSLQKQLLTKVVEKAKKGYLLCNSCPRHFGIKPLKKEDLLSKLRKAHASLELLPEEPRLGKDHYLIVWQ